MNKIDHGRLQTLIFDSYRHTSITIEALSKIITPDKIASALQQSDNKIVRLRKLHPCAVVWLVIAMSLFRNMNITMVWWQVIGILRALLSVGTSDPPLSKSALSQARQRLKARPMRLLFGKVACPVATEQDSDCFYHGMRLMGIDGMRMRVADTPDNRRVFGAGGFTTRHGKRIEGTYPQIHAIGLVELGTHVICDALIKPGLSSEQRGVSYLFKQMPKNSLVMLDAGFYGYPTLEVAMSHHVQLLGRVGSGAKFKREKILADGSFVTTIYPSDRRKRKHAKGLNIRVIEYTFDDPNRPGYQQRHQIYTTLLDADKHPAKQLIVLYHQRWEQEIVHDELKTHQLTKDLPTHLRSKTPVGVIQEFYGMLIGYDAVRKIMYESAVAYDLEPRQLSFIRSIRIIRQAVALMRLSETQRLPVLYKAILNAIADKPLPPRQDRINPRVVKTPLSKYTRKKPNMPPLPQPEKPFDQAITILN